MSQAARGNFYTGRSNKEENHLDAKRDKWKKEGGKEGGEPNTTPFAKAFSLACQQKCHMYKIRY